MRADALTRLVHRTLRPEPALQPYTPSIFETPGDADADMLVQEVTATAPPPVSRVAPAPADRIDRAGAFESHAWEAVARAEHPQADPVVVAQVRPAWPMPVETTTALVQAPRERPVPSVEHVRVVARVVERVPVDDATRHADPPQPRPALAPAAAPAVEPIKSATPAAVLMPPDLPPERVTEAEPPEPVISISIGRIEVRTTTATVPQRSDRPRERRVMSLDEYLERRARGSHQ